MNESIRTREDPVKRYFENKNALEGIEGKEVGRFTIGLDILFCEDDQGEPQTLIAEVNGKNSGNETPTRVGGPKDRLGNLFTDIRNTKSEAAKNSRVWFTLGALGLFDGGESAQKAFDLFFNRGKFGADVLKIQKEWGDEQMDRFLDKNFALSEEAYKAFRKFMKIRTLHEFETWKKDLPDAESVDCGALKTLLEWLLQRPVKKYGYDNHPALEMIFENKLHMPNVIDSANQVQEWTGDTYISPTGFWIAKPSKSARQIGIIILSNEQLQRRVKRDPHCFDRHIVQVLKPTKKPDNAPENFAGRNAFMRLRLDVVYRKNAAGERNTQIAYGDSVMCVFRHKDTEKSKSLPSFANIDFPGEADYFKPSKEELAQALSAAQGSITRITEKLDDFAEETSVLHRLLRELEAVIRRRGGTTPKVEGQIR